MIVRAMARYCDFVTTDVFTSTRFSGNPLAIVFLPSASDFVLSQAQKQLIAREFNHSETVFIHAASDSALSERTIDIFTSDSEIPFGGHPVVGTAALLLDATVAMDEAGVVPTALLTKSGQIPIALTPPRFGTNAAVRIGTAHDTRLHQARFPAAELLRFHPTLAPYIPAAASFPVFSILRGMSQVHVELPSLDALSAVGKATGMVPGDDTYLDMGWYPSLVMLYFFVRGVQDGVLGREVIRARMIFGQLEDPASGSAACGIGAYLAMSEGLTGEQRFDIVQGVEMGRRSEIGVDVEVGRDGKIESVDLVGSAAEVSSGRILVPE